LAGLNKTNSTAEQTLKAIKVGKVNYLAIALIPASNRSRYSRLMNDLQNQFKMVYISYLVNVTAAYNLIINYLVTGQSTARIINDSEGVAFTTVEKGVSFATVENEKSDYSKIKCFRCQKKGQFANHCPKNEEDNASEGGGEVTESLPQLIIVEPPENYDTYDELAFDQTYRHINPSWIILDTGSMSNIFCNKNLVSNLRLSSGSMKVHCNAGTKAVKHDATLKNYGAVWFNEEGIANIFSMSLVKNKFLVGTTAQGGGSVCCFQA
jgi:hypothetical protein